MIVSVANAWSGKSKPLLIEQHWMVVGFMSHSSLYEHVTLKRQEEKTKIVKKKCYE